MNAAVAGPGRTARRVASRGHVRISAALVAVAVLGGVVTGCGATATSPGPVATPPAVPSWSSTAPFGAWNNGGFIVYNNEWNTSEAGQQVIWANSYHHWGVTSTQAATTSVKTYPSVQKDFRDVPVDSFTTIKSTFSQVMPASGDFEAAYDLWLKGPKAEVMFWVDNHGQRPAGSLIGTAGFGGRTWAIWRSGGYFAFVLDHNEASGSVDILAGLKHLVAQGWLPGTAAIWQIDFGWEICSTRGVPENFAVTGYSLTAH